MARFHYSKGYTQYGAQMGRRAINEIPEDFAPKVALQRVPLDQGGYDPGGAYWGSGRGSLPLFRAVAEYEDSFEGATSTLYLDKYYRAKSREQAKELVRKELPKARFYK